MKRQSFNLAAINNTAFDRVEMPVDNIQAFQTTRLSPNNSADNLINNSISPQVDSSSLKPECFEHFNLGLHVSDIPENVLKNRHQLLTYLPQRTSIQWLEQVHGNNVVTVEKLSKPFKADALITRSSKLALAIMTADCLPILLCNRKCTEIAAIHAGWRSLASGIITETLSKMQSDSRDIYAWLGPCISQNNFEVGGEVKNNFEALNQSFATAFIVNDKSDDKDKWLADLKKIAQLQLTKQGVKNIAISSHCTFDENERYYSYRKERKTGRMAAIICIK